MPPANLQLLENKIERLLYLYMRTAEENRFLRERESELLEERAALFHKTELARTRIEALIARLKIMETEAS